MDDQIKQAYQAGFATACARMGIDPADLLKLAEDQQAAAETSDEAPISAEEGSAGVAMDKAVAGKMPAAKAMTQATKGETPAGARQKTPMMKSRSSVKFTPAVQAKRDASAAAAARAKAIFEDSKAQTAGAIAASTGR